MLEPGVVHFGGRGAFVLGELDGRISERIVHLRDALHDFDPGATVSDNIWGYLWGKMGYGAILFATALTDASIVDVLASPDARPALASLAREVMAVAAAARVTPLGFNGYDPAAFAAGAPQSAVDESFEAMIVVQPALGEDAHRRLARHRGASPQNGSGSAIHSYPRYCSKT